MFRALLKTLRPRQWVKNLFVAAPLIFAQRLFHVPSLIGAALAVALFCALSSCVYVLNDIVDVDRDRAHPKKRDRPIASGELPIGVAKAVVGVLAPAVIVIGFLYDVWLGATLSGYFALNLAYSFSLKHVAYVDVLCIALGFLLRVLAGAFAVHEPASGWLLGCTAALALFLGFGKRAHELASAKERASEQRNALAAYTPGVLKALLWLLAVSTLALYGAYTISPHAVSIFGDYRFALTLPLPAFGLARFVTLVSRHGDSESPTDAMLHDPWFIGDLVLWGVLSVVLLYV